MVKIKKLLVEYGRKIARRHLVMGAMGNISIRDAKQIWIKRGGAWLENAKPEDFVVLDLQTGRCSSGRCPSKEMYLHLGCYRARGDIGAVVHTHPVLTTALATVGISLDRRSKRLSEIVDSPILTLPYCSPGSKKLACGVQRTIRKVNAVMLADHGLVTVGKDIRQAYQRTLVCELASKKILLAFEKIKFKARE